MSSHRIQLLNQIRKESQIPLPKKIEKNKKLAADNLKKAHKMATLLYNEEKKKGKEGKSAQKVREMVLLEYEVALSVRTIQRYAKNGMAGKSPIKKGPEGNIDKFVFDTMCQAFSSMINISQLNGASINTREKLRARVNAFFGETDVCALSVP